MAVLVATMLIIVSVVRSVSRLFFMVLPFSPYLCGGCCILVFLEFCYRTNLVCVVVSGCGA